MREGVTRRDWLALSGLAARGNGSAVRPQKKRGPYRRVRRNRYPSPRSAATTRT